MKTMHSTVAIHAENQFGRAVARRLSAGSQDLPHDIGERLRAARVQAVLHRRSSAMAPTMVIATGPAATLGGGWWTRIGSVVPFVALLAGLIAISVVQDDRRANELAEVDSALLTDELPTAAFTDPGFAQFLKAEAAAER